MHRSLLLHLRLNIKIFRSHSLLGLHNFRHLLLRNFRHLLLKNSRHLLLRGQRIWSLEGHSLIPPYIGQELHLRTYINNQYQTTLQSLRSPAVIPRSLSSPTRLHLLSHLLKAMHRRTSPRYRAQRMRVHMRLSLLQLEILQLHSNCRLLPHYNREARPNLTQLLRPLQFLPRRRLQLSLLPRQTQRLSNDQGHHLLRPVQIQSFNCSRQKRQPIRI